MTKIYYPKTNTFMIVHEGKLYGVCGAIAERFFKRSLESGDSVMIGIQPIPTAKKDWKNVFSNN